MLHELCRREFLLGRVAGGWVPWLMQGPAGAFRGLGELGQKAALCGLLLVSSREFRIAFPVLSLLVLNCSHVETSARDRVSVSENIDPCPNDDGHYVSRSAARDAVSGSEPSSCQQLREQERHIESLVPDLWARRSLWRPWR